MKMTSFASAALCLGLPCAFLLPGCGGGNGIAVPTPSPTATSTATPTATFTPAPTATSTPKVGTANISFVAQNGAYFGSSPYSVTGVTAQDQNGTDLIIGFAPFINGSDARYFTLFLHHSGAIQNGQTFPLGSQSSNLVASAPSSPGSGNYISYGGAGFSSGTARVLRSGNVATFTLQNVVVRNNDSATPSSASLSFNATITVTLPPTAR